MTDTLFEYDHILMRSEYRTPDIHSHLALHLIVGLGAAVANGPMPEKPVNTALFRTSPVYP